MKQINLYFSEDRVNLYEISFIKQPQATEFLKASSIFFYWAIIKCILSKYVDESTVSTQVITLTFQLFASRFNNINRDKYN